MLTHPAIIAAFALWCGVVWRLRGGALTTLTGWNPGTDGARAICGVLIAGPLAWLAHDWRVLILAPAIVGGLMLTGWGPFQGMGLEDVPGYKPEASWLRWPPHEIGLRDGSIGMDAMGMAEAGFLCMSLSALAVIAMHGLSLNYRGLLVALAGALFPIPYLIARFVPLPRIPRFAAGQAWGEVGAGMLVGAALAFSFLH